MGRWGGSPTTVESCMTLSLKELRKWGYLKPNGIKAGTIAHSRGGRERASYGICVNTFEEDSYIQFSYTITKRNGEKKDIDYQVKLVTCPANIGNGVRYYFLCPNTGKRCLKLYSPPNEDYFLHRSAFPYLVYEKQIDNKRMRALDTGIIGMAFKIDKLERELIWKSPKYHRNYYNGKPTKRFQKLLDLRKRLSGYTMADFEEEMQRGFRS